MNLFIPIALSILFSVCNIPDSDDLAVFHPALYISNNLDKPITINDHSHVFGELPQISFLHGIASYEAWTTINASIFRIPPLVLYQILLPIFWIFYFYFIVLECLSFFTNNHTHQTIGGLIFFLFLLADGRSALSIGNSSFVRFWQAKALMWNVLPMAIVMLFLKYRFEKKRIYIFLLGIAFIASVGLSNTSLFLIPILWVILLTTDFTCNETRLPVSKYLLLLALCFYPALLASLQLFHIFPSPKSMEAWNVGWETQWWKNIGLLVGTQWNMAWRGLLVCTVIFFSKGKVKKTLIIYFSLCILIFLNPLMAQFWIDKISVASYWRFGFIFFLPFLASLLYVYFIECIKQPAWRPGFILCVLALNIWPYSHIFSHPLFSWKKPSQLRFTPNERDFILHAEPLLQGKSLLAPEQVIVPALIIVPSLRAEASLYGLTVHLFNEIDQVEEGIQRVYAQRLVAIGDFSEDTKNQFIKSLPRIDSIICPTEFSKKVKELINLNSSNHWEVIFSEFNLSLLQKTENQLK